MVLLMPDDVPLHYKSIRVTLIMDYKEFPCFEILEPRKIRDE